MVIAIRNPTPLKKLRHVREGEQRSLYFQRAGAKVPPSSLQSV